MILVIDTSSSVAAVALLGESPLDFTMSSRSQELLPQLRRVAAENPITRVAVATGPGSFTGLRVGASFALGLAIGLGIPIVPLPSLALQAARSMSPATAVIEAGRGRFYFQVPGGDVALGEPADIPVFPRLVGRLTVGAGAALLTTGHLVMLDVELLPFARATAKVLETAREVPYQSLKLEYVQSFGART